MGMVVYPEAPIDQLENRPTVISLDRTVLGDE